MLPIVMDIYIVLLKGDIHQGMNSTYYSETSEDTSKLHKDLDGN